MKRIALIVAATLALAACQTAGGPGPQPTPHPIITPERCATALRGINGASPVLAVLESLGLPPNVAAAASTLLAIGKTSVTVICAVFAPGKPLPAHPDELPPPPPGQ